MSESLDDKGKDRLASIEDRLERIERKVDRMLGLYDALGSIAAGIPPRLVAALHSMSPAEHVAMQMVLDNRSNHEIAVCLDVAEEHVRSWVESATEKLGLASRADLRKTMQPVFRAIPPEEYKRASGGIPKDWNDKYGVDGIPDPYRHIYHPDAG